MPADLLLESPEAPPFPVARFSVDQYHRMIESGAFTEEDRIELLEGWVVPKMPKSPEHEFVVGEMEEGLRKQAPAGWFVRNQAPITLPESEPEPDLSLARGTRRDYVDSHPGAEALALVVEVSDTTLATDRRKAAVYGKAGIPAYWLINLRDRVIEVFETPDAEHVSGYRQHRVVAIDKPLVLTEPSLEISPREVFPE